MQGIDHLDFRPDKFGNQDIVGMVSAQEELVNFSNIIYPVDAKGMVEKWLLQVEKQMIKSLRDTIEKAMSSYYTTPLTNWVLDWAGQVGQYCQNKVGPQLYNQSASLLIILSNRYMQWLEDCIAI